MSPEGSSAEATRLLTKACPNERAEFFFKHQMAVAESLGMTWVEGLRFAILQRMWNGGLV